MQLRSQPLALHRWPPAALESRDRAGGTCPWAAGLPSQGEMWFCGVKSDFLS